MLTFTDQLNMCQDISGLSDASSLINFKRDLQKGAAKFLAKLSLPITELSRYTSAIANQQYYQMPEDAIKPTRVSILIGSQWYDLTEVGSEATWIDLNSGPQTGNPTHYFVRGNDEIGFYPVPSSNVVNGIQLYFEPRHVLITASDYTTGTVSVVNGSAVVTSTTALFTPQMANGSYVLQLTDGNDGLFYRIASFQTSQQVTLENVYQGLTVAAGQYRIGQVTRIPEEYQDAPIDYAMFRHFTEKGEAGKAMYHKQLWTDSREEAEAVYGSKTSNQIIKSSRSMGHTFNPLTDITQNQIRT
jgi:hypothetical protein